MKRLNDALKLLHSANIEATALRTDILTILAKSKTPMSAYQLLDKLQAVRTNAKPMTVYRTLATFEKIHLVHKIEKDSTYVLCDHPNQHCDCHIVFCSACGAYQEIHDPAIHKHIVKAIHAAGFSKNHEPVQISAICQQCA